MAADHEEDGDGAATRTFSILVVGAVLFSAACFFILL
jgi:hypothetical protein